MDAPKPSSRSVASKIPPASLQPPRLELAKGGGSLRGAEEKFQVNPLTGTCGVDIALPLSPGRGGIDPPLSLGYDSGAGDGPFGLGWSLSLPSIARQTTKRLPLYDDAVESDVFVLSGSEDLVPVGDLGAIDGFLVRSYRPRVEGSFARIERWTTSDGICHWRLYGTDASVTHYGLDPESTVADPDVPGRIFRWLPSRGVDAAGNVMRFRYLADGVQRHLSSVLYGNKVPFTSSSEADDFHFRAGFEYQARPDFHTDRRPGFPVRTSVRCQRMVMEHNFPELGPDPMWVARLEFAYAQSDSGISLLASATRQGHRILADQSSEILEMPPLVFEYQPHAWNQVWQDLPADATADVAGGIANSQWVDLWGEGLPGLLSERTDTWWYKQNLGGGHFAPGREVSPKPLPAKASGLMDLEGDGHMWLVQHEGSAGSVRLVEEGRWAGKRAFRAAPKIDFGSPRVKFLDLDGDGRTDVVIDEGDHLTWYPSQGEDGYEGPRQRVKEMDGEPVQLLAHGRHEAVFLADMTGDGLADVVRVRSSEICYWPHLGHGKFGEKIAMADSPVFANAETFDPSLVRLTDLDGTGTADLVYLDLQEIQVWLNWGGERFGARRSFPQPGNVGVRLEAIDLLGQGTACLVWTSPWAADAQVPGRYLDLCAGKKPHLMSGYRNQMGKQVTFEYTASTTYYLADRLAGTPWATRLPYVVQCLSRVTTRDLVTGWSQVRNASYHHGCHDGFEREFRGFGRVDTIDAEAGLDPSTDQDPVLTRTWFHLGVAPDGKWLPQVFASEYWRPADASLPDSPRLEPLFPPALTPRDWHEAHRSFKGRILREEVYGQDSSSVASIPYATTDHVYSIAKIASSLVPGDRIHPAGVWLVTESESFANHLERNASDPRLSHDLVLERDAYGRATLAAAVVYGRRPGGAPADVPAPVLAEQSRRHVVAIQTIFASDFEPGSSNDRTWRMGPTREIRTWELTGTSPSGSFHTAAELAAALEAASPLDFEGIPDAELLPPPPTLRIQKRLVDQARAEFWNDALSGPRPAADATPGRLGMVYQNYALSYTTSLLEHLFGPGRVFPAMLTEGGYAPRDDGSWWIPSGHHTFSADARDHFCLPDGLLDPFGTRTDIEYDDHDLLVTQVRDALGNIHSAANDYRTLAPSLTTDPNGNRVAVEVDALGTVIKSALMGKPGAGEGDTLDDPTTRMTYSLTAFLTDGSPNWVRTLGREKHGPSNPRFQERVEYSDGLGQVAMAKVQAEPGLAWRWNLALERMEEVDTGSALRWVGTGRKILNNKGNSVKEFEPYFSVDDSFEREPELVQAGVTHILHYDPLGRRQRTDNPDGTHTRVEFTAWVQRGFDATDTVLDSQWYLDRGAPPPTAPEPSDPERRAAWLAARLAGTPSVSHLDSLGRDFYAIADNGADGQYVTRTVLDIEGNELRIIDARNNTVMEYRHGIHGEKAHTRSMDAGDHWTLLAVDATPIYTWDSRDQRIHLMYDPLRRPIRQWLATGGAPEILVGSGRYGEEAPSPETFNLRGKPWLAYDPSGLVENRGFDFKGNLLGFDRRLATEYKTTVDWNVPDPSALLQAELFSTTTEYDALDRVTRILTPHNPNLPANEVLPTYNQANFLERVDVRLRGAATETPFVTNIDYDAKGQRRRIAYGNGSTTGYSYDPKTFRLRRLLTTRNGGADILQDLRYSFDPVGNIVQIDDLAQQSIFYRGQVVDPSQKFQYDALYRLVRSTGREHVSLGAGSEPEAEGYNPAPISPEDGNAMRNYTRQWRYDEVGNILALLHQANGNSWNRAFAYAPESNRLATTTVGTSTDSYVHNAHGSMLSMPHLETMDWDFAERLSHVARGTTQAWHCYDGAGQRIRKVVEKGGIREERIYLGSVELFRRSIGGTLALQRETLQVIGDNRRLAIAETLAVDGGVVVANPSPVLRYQLDNHLGSATLELDASADVISYEEYYAYGDTSYRAGRSAAEVGAKRYRHSGKEKDEETGLYHFGARYYACWLSRWTAADPAGLVDGVCLYAYVKNHPLGLIDPDGRQAKKPPPSKPIPKPKSQPKPGPAPTPTPAPAPPPEKLTKFDKPIGAFSVEDLNQAAVTVFGEMTARPGKGAKDEARAVASTIFTRKRLVDETRKKYATARKDYQEKKEAYDEALTKFNDIQKRQRALKKEMGEKKFMVMFTEAKAAVGKAQKAVAASYKLYAVARDQVISAESYLSPANREATALIAKGGTRTPYTPSGPASLADIAGQYSQYEGSRTGKKYFEGYAKSSDQASLSRRWEIAKQVVADLAEKPASAQKYTDHNAINHASSGRIPARAVQIGDQKFWVAQDWLNYLK